jgi:hypothetical protein
MACPSAMNTVTLFTSLSNHIAGVQRLYAQPWLTPLWQVSPYTGALNQLWAAELPVDQARGIGGAYVGPYQKALQPRPDVCDPAAVDTMWEWCKSQARGWREDKDEDGASC